MTNRNTHTTKKYAISLIQEIKSEAIEKLNLAEPDLNEHKQVAFKNKEVGLIAPSNIEKLIRANKNGYYGSYLGSIDCVKLLNIPESYKAALKEFKKNSPNNQKLLKKIEDAYDQAEATIMLGGTDTAMGQAVEKLKELVSKIR